MERKKTAMICRIHKQIRLGQDWHSFDFETVKMYELKLKRRHKEMIALINTKCPLCIKEK